MKKVLFLTTACLTVFATGLFAQEATIFPKGQIGANTDNYTGTIWLNELNHPDSNFSFSLAQAYYAPGSKLNWHIHPAGQYLLITDGVGFYQEKGKPIQIVRKGEVIKCLPGVEHWHAAAPNTSFTYVGVTPTQKGKTIWKQPVTDEEYQSRSKQGAISNTSASEQEILALSKQKWQWMSDKTVEPLNELFHDSAMFIHMGGSWGKSQELEVIKTGNIWYKKAAIYSATANIIGNTAILLNDIDLLAVVGGNEVVNPFMVTEVYINEGGKWKLGSLTFSRLLRAVKMKTDNSQ